MTRVSVVGVGAMGRNHVRVYQEMPDTEVVAIVDVDREQAERVGRIYHLPVYTDVEEMIARERPEAVSVAVPTHLHFPVVKALLEAGCHVLVEKPIAGTVAEAIEMNQLAEQAGVVLAVGHIERFNPAITELKRRLEAGELGRIFQIEARRIGPFPARIQDVGVIMDLATHDLDIMQYLVGERVRRVFAEARRVLHAHCEDLFLGMLRFDDHTLGMLEINWLTPTKIRELYVTGERGMFQVNYLAQDLCFFENSAVRESNWPTLDLMQGVSQGSRTHFAIQQKEPLRAELEGFIGRVQGKESPIVDAHQATITLALAERLVGSAWNGAVSEVSYDEFSQRTPDAVLARDNKAQPSSLSTYQASA